MADLSDWSARTILMVSRPKQGVAGYREPATPDQNKLMSKFGHHRRARRCDSGNSYRVVGSNSPPEITGTRREIATCRASARGVCDTGAGWRFDELYRKPFMPSTPTTFQFDLFFSHRNPGIEKVPQWQARTIPTHHQSTPLIVRLLLNHAAGDPAPAGEEMRDDLLIDSSRRCDSRRRVRLHA